MDDEVLRGRELPPTKENIYQTLVSNALGRNEHVLQLARRCYSIDRGAISLDAPWGEGKTFLVKQAQMFLDAYNPSNNELTEEERRIVKRLFIWQGAENAFLNFPVLTVYYDAWLHDGDVDPALSLVYEVASATHSENLLEDDPDFKGIIEKIAGAFVKKDLSKFATSSHGSSALDELKQARKREDTIKEFFHWVLPERGERMVVFVDELDRCSPSFAIQLLERVKHFFDIENVVFVFSVNVKELQHTIKRFYGEQFDATKYLSRFFSISVSLPKVDRERFLEWEFGNAKTWFEVSWYCFCKHYELSMRDMLRMQQNMESIGQALIQKGEEDYDKGVSFVKTVLVPIVFGLKLYSLDLYNQFVSGENWEPMRRIVLDRRLKSIISPMETATKSAVRFVEEIYSVIFGEGGEKLECNGYVFAKEMRKDVLQWASQLSFPN